MLDEPGITRALALDRARRVGALRYDVRLDVPRSRQQPIAGVVRIRFLLSDPSSPLLLDFAPDCAGALQRVVANGVVVTTEVARGHLALDVACLRPGENTVELWFEAGDASLNRRDELLYSIFVPARAHEAFPCFDQPDLKARWTLTLALPAEWTAVSNAAARPPVSGGEGRHVLSFAESRPLPTYLFAFAAGRFAVERVERDGQTMQVFHTGVEPERVADNLTAVVDAHADALRWMTDYTSLPYPFDTFDIVVLPAFQFSGMEHPGAIFYNASTLLLPPAATEQQQLARAHVIAHETAHMWFGDLVTMTWFDDVWMKEVFANVMAARIVNPRFADVEHELRFLHAHYPGAYDVDRTAGTHPIRQPLDNLKDASSLYGAIIYLKSPVMMRQLELLLGAEQLRNALRRYLAAHAYGNATWPELVRELSVGASVDVGAWAHAWVDEAGRPRVRAEATCEGDTVVRFSLSMDAALPGDELPGGPASRAAQRLDLAVGRGGQVEHVTCWLDGQASVEALVGLPAPDYVLPNGRGLGYGEFHLDERSRTWLLAHLPEIPDALTRGSAWLTLWDAMLCGTVDASSLLALSCTAIVRETNEANLQRILTCTERLFWIFTDSRHEVAVIAALDGALREALASAQTMSARAAVFATLRTVALERETLDWMQALWSGDAVVDGLPLGEAEQVALAQDLSVRAPGTASWVAQQLGRTLDPERREALAFVAPALSGDPLERDRFFASLAAVENRRREPWVVDGMRWLHHPLRELQSHVYIEPGLELLEEVRRTGDIFLPKRWVDAMLSGHRAPRAARSVQTFLASRPATYPDALRRLVRASADPLERAARRSRGQGVFEQGTA